MAKFLMSDEQAEKEVALATLAKRREENKDQKPVDNSSLPAGSSMYFQCDICKGQIVLPEDYQPPRPRLCFSCSNLEKRGWLPKEGDST